MFRDEQIKGPFSSWVHTHRFEPAGEGSRLIDEVECSLPFEWLLRPLVRRRLEKMFRFRHDTTRGQFATL